MTYRSTTSQKASSLYSKPDDIDQSSVLLLPCKALSTLFNGDEEDVTIEQIDITPAPALLFSANCWWPIKR